MAEVKAPASADVPAAAPEKIEQDQAAVVKDERTLAGVLKEIADLFGIAAPVVVQAVVPRSPLRLSPPLRRMLTQELAEGDKNLLYIAMTSDKTLIGNLIESDASAFKDGTLRLPELDLDSINRASDLRNLAYRIGSRSYVRRVDLKTDASGFSLNAGYDIMASGVITGPHILTPKQRVEKFKASPDFAASTESADRFRPINATGAPAYPQASRNPFGTGDYVEYFAPDEKVDVANARLDFTEWLELGASGGLAQVSPEGAHKYVIVVVGGSVYETPVADTKSDLVDPRLRAAVDKAGIVGFMHAMAAERKVGDVSYELFTKLWQLESANSDWLKTKFRDAHEGMHEWIPSNYIPDTIGRASRPDRFAEGAAWIDLHHELRVDTSLLIFNPGHWLPEEGPKPVWVPQGHSGAVYVGPEPQTNHQNLFHDALRRAFDSSTGIHSCIQNIQAVFEAWIWDGSGGKTPIHPLLRGKGGTVLDPATLATYQAGNFADVMDFFKAITGRFGGAVT